MQFQKRFGWSLEIYVMLVKNHCWNNLVGVGSPKVNRQEGQPDDACSIHGKSDEFWFVKILGDLSRLYCVDGAYNNQKDIEDLAEQ